MTARAMQSVCQPPFTWRPAMISRSQKFIEEGAYSMNGMNGMNEGEHSYKLTGVAEKQRQARPLIHARDARRVRGPAKAEADGSLLADEGQAAVRGHVKEGQQSVDTVVGGTLDPR